MPLYDIFTLPVDKFVEAIPKNVSTLDFDLFPIITPVIIMVVCITERATQWSTQICYCISERNVL